MSTTSIQLVKKISPVSNLLILADKEAQLAKAGLSAEQLNFVKKAVKNKQKPVTLNDAGRFIFVILNEDKEKGYKVNEAWRKDACAAAALCNQNKLEELSLVNATGKKNITTYVAEGVLLGNYQFLKYRTVEPNGAANSLKTFFINNAEADVKLIKNVLIATEAVLIARDLVNEPLSYLTAEQLSKEIQKLGKEAGFTVEVFNKAKIQSLKMGGLLGVNLGSPNPPTFNILEWKPKGAKNKNPYVLVGKGVVYDTGGLSLKPTAGMDIMKCDMAGAAAAACAIYAVAKAKLPVHVVGLIPATENRPGGNAYVPGDVLTMHNGSTVEVLNTDAEGRLILADALSYAKNYKPELVIDLATLTGAAARAIGPEGIVYMSTAKERVNSDLERSGNEVYERLVEFPLWEEYDSYIKSDIADVKNIGGINAGAITAGMFLKKFTDYPWIHLDIAGPAFLEKPDGYRLKNGSGVGVRLLFDFLKNKAN